MVYGDAYVPSLPLSLETAVAEILDIATDPPACLRFDPAPRRVDSAYRGSLRAQDPTFHGCDFGDALARARTAAAGLVGEGEVIRQEIRTYAWPILWLRYRVLGVTRDAALVVAPDRSLRALLGS